MSHGAAPTLTPSQGSGGRARESVISGYVLRLARESAGADFSQERCAELLGVSVDTIAGWETGRRPLGAVRAGQLVSIQNTLVRSGASTSLVQLLSSALQADDILDFARGIGGAYRPGGSHPLGAFVHRREVIELAAWPLSGRLPTTVPASTTSRSRRGPVSQGPEIDTMSRGEVFEHLRRVVDTSRGDDSLLHRQALYVLSYDRRPDAGAWIADQYRQVPRRHHGWSPAWPIVRTLASALVRHGDPSMLLDFADAGLADEQGQIANLNYWAYWVGETTAIERDDSFMPGSLGTWRGDRILRHLAARLDAEDGVADLGIHSLRTLLAARPRLLDEDRQLTVSLMATVEQVMDGGRMSPSARQALAEIRYALRLHDK